MAIFIHFNTCLIIGPEKRGKKSLNVFLTHSNTLVFNLNVVGFVIVCVVYFFYALNSNLVTNC